jgi:hypothetical protein
VHLAKLCARFYAPFHLYIDTDFSDMHNTMSFHLTRFLGIFFLANLISSIDFIHCASSVTVCSDCLNTSSLSLSVKEEVNKRHSNSSR